MDIIPYFAELSKEGPVGRRKLNQITRYVGIALHSFKDMRLVMPLWVMLVVWIICMLQLF